MTDLYMDGCKCVCDAVQVTANTIEKAPIGSFRNALEIGLVLFVILLVILGLIIGFNKLKQSDVDDSEEKDKYENY